MSLVKLKDSVVENIQDNSVDYEIFGETFSGSVYETTSDFIIDLEDGRTIKLSGYNTSSYETPSGFSNYGNLIVELLRKVYNRETDEMTIVDLVHWAFTNYADGNIQIIVEDENSNIYKKGLLKNHDAVSYSNDSNEYLSWIKYTFRSLSIDKSLIDELKVFMNSKPEIFVFNQETSKYYGTTLEDFLIV